jgi:hypothetical protein
MSKSKQTVKTNGLAAARESLAYRGSVARFDGEKCWRFVFIVVLSALAILIAVHLIISISTP